MVLAILVLLAAAIAGAGTLVSMVITGVAIAPGKPSIASMGRQLTERDGLQAAHAAGIGDDWPTGRGHVLLGAAGDVVANKAYVEPDGSFSPAPASFGLSLVALDARGLPVAAGQAAGSRTQRLELRDGAKIPDLLTESALASMRIVAVGPQQWTITVIPRALPAGAASLGVQIRSIGPTGSALRYIRAVLPDLIDIDGRWLLSAAPALRTITALPEMAGFSGAVLAHFGLNTNNWQRVTAVLPSSQGPIRLSVRAQHAAAPGAVDLPPISLPELSVPSPQFADALAAQVQHLAMGIEGWETRPGDPLNYTYEWARDGAYVLVALAASGNEAMAEQLAPHFFSKDYFGGFGAEADAPGLSLWMLDEIVSRDPGSDLAQRLWPQIEHKVELLQHCLDTDSRFWYAPPLPPFDDDPSHLPIELVCGPPVDGVVLGKMDNHFPVAYVAAVTFGGLSAAARLAERTGHAARAATWRSLAVNVEHAWAALAQSTKAQRRWQLLSALAHPHVLSEVAHDPGGSIRALNLMYHGYLCFECDTRYDSAALWPFGVGAAIEDSIRGRLEAHLAAKIGPSGEFTARPEWPYFDIELGHQLLLVGDRGHAWNVLQWFFDHQLAPGLYTWGEGSHETNGPGAWNDIRGWVDARDGVTPHYWMAAEMVLLQLDMLVHVAVPLPSRPNEPLRVQIGLGVPDDWLRTAFSVQGVLTRVGRICWRWDTSRLMVTVPDDSVRIEGSGPFAGHPLTHSKGICGPDS